MKKISYTAHLELRIKLRGISRDVPRQIYLKAQEHYYDQATQKLIAVKRLKHKGKVRELAVIYEESEKEICIITIHPLKEYQKIARVKSGRWQNYEK